jgi:hypothetical protein
MISFPDRTESFSDNDGYQLAALLLSLEFVLFEDKFQGFSQVRDSLFLGLALADGLRQLYASSCIVTRFFILPETNSEGALNHFQSVSCTSQASIFTCRSRSQQMDLGDIITIFQAVMQSQFQRPRPKWSQECGEDTLQAIESMPTYHASTSATPITRILTGYQDWVLPHLPPLVLTFRVSRRRSDPPEGYHHAHGSWLEISFARQITGGMRMGE